MPHFAARFATVSAGVAIAAACGSVTDAPLGGPYGGDSFIVGPSDGGNHSGVDAAYTPPSPPLMPGVPQGNVNTWTHIFTSYLAKGTIGNCTTCHPQMKDPKGAFSYLSDTGYVGDSAPLLTDEGASCLSWYGGGSMPPQGKKSLPDVVAEMNKWASLGGRNN